MERITAHISSLPENKPTIERIIGAIAMTINLLMLVVGLATLPSNVEWLGIEWWRIVSVSIAISALLVVHSFVRENRQMRQTFKEAFEPKRAKIRALLGVRDSVERFEQGREEPQSEEEYAEHGRVLSKHLNDACKHGLYESPYFSDERMAMQIDGDALVNFRNVVSIMERRRAIPHNRLWRDKVPDFRKWLLDDIQKEIEMETVFLRD